MLAQVPEELIKKKERKINIEAFSFMNLRGNNNYKI
jgi:hypothetical protein